MFNATVGGFISTILCGALIDPRTAFIFGTSAYKMNIVIQALILPLVLAAFSTTIGGFTMGTIVVEVDPPFKKYGPVGHVYWSFTSCLVSVLTLGVGSFWQVLYPCCCGDGYQFGADYLCGYLTVDQKRYEKLLRKYTVDDDSDIDSDDDSVSD